MTLSRRALLGASVAALSSACDRRRPSRPGTVSLWFTYGGNNRKVLLELVDRFHAQQSEVRVEATFQGDYFEGLVKLRTGLFVGAAPSLSHVVGEVIPYLAQAGALEPIDDIGAATIDDLEPALAQHGTFSGAPEGQQLLALPFNRSTPIAYYNVPLFDELGLKPPTTWDEMREVARACTQSSGKTIDRYGFECPIDWWFWIALMGQAGGELFDADGRLSLGADAGVEAVQHWQTMVHADRTMKPPAGRDYNAWEATNTDFLAGRVAMIWTSTAFLRYLEKNARFQVGTAPLPKKARYAVPTGGTFFVVPRGVTGEEKESALTFLRWMMAAPQANYWATHTGYMPVSSSGRALLQSQGYYAERPNDKVTLDQLANALPWPWVPELFRVQREAVQPRLEEAVLKQRDARLLLDEARRSVAGP
jgi:sn-glycerol 3-phosphate transport system substrate-binding protein